MYSKFVGEECSINLESSSLVCFLCMSMTFFFNATATTEIYTYCPTLSLHDALPICMVFKAPRTTPSNCCCSWLQASTSAWGRASPLNENVGKALFPMEIGRAHV